LLELAFKSIIPNIKEIKAYIPVTRYTLNQLITNNHKKDTIGVIIPTIVEIFMRRLSLHLLLTINNVILMILNISIGNATKINPIITDAIGIVSLSLGIEKYTP